MFGIGTSELILIMVIVLIFLGPKKIPQIARGLGRAVSEFRRATSEVKDKISSFSEEVHEKVNSEVSAVERVLEPKPEEKDKEDKPS